MRTLPASLSAADGTGLHLRHRPRDGARGTVLVVHGLGEHAGRYESVAAWLNARGWDVVAYDQRGHGHSEGARGVIPTADALLRDLELVIDLARPSEIAAPLVLLGHSMGGAVAAHLVAEKGRAVDGFVLTSPALAADLSGVQRLQLLIGERLAP